MIGDTKYPDLMLDIETLANTSGAAVLSVAAVPFNADTGEIADKADCFHEFVYAEAELKDGAETNADTILWWLGQSDAARNSIIEGQKKAQQPYAVYNKLKNYVWSISPKPASEDGTTPVRVWGNGASFDIPVLENAFRRQQEQVPWRYGKHRCFRTLKNLLPEYRMPQMVEPELKHNALEDAYAQALNAISILKVIRTRME